MSRSNKARYTRNGKLWKDTAYASRSQAQARAKRKRRAAQQKRAQEKARVVVESKNNG
jgi:hypothetical protein